MDKLSAKERSRLRYAEVRNQRRCKDLVVIEATPLRRRAITGARRWFVKVEKLQWTIDRFYAKDQKLFNDWHELTFRSLVTQIENMHGEFLRLARFHNQMILLSENGGMSIPEAY